MGRQGVCAIFQEAVVKGLSSVQDLGCMLSSLGLFLGNPLAIALQALLMLVLKPGSFIADSSSFLWICFRKNVTVLPNLFIALRNLVLPSVPATLSREMFAAVSS